MSSARSSSWYNRFIGWDRRQSSRTVALIAAVVLIFGTGCEQALTAPQDETNRSAVLDTLFAGPPASSAGVWTKLNRAFPNEFLNSAPTALPNVQGSVMSRFSIYDDDTGGAFYGTIWINSYVYARVYGPHYNYAGPKAGNVTHMNVAVYQTKVPGRDREHGGGLSTTRANLHISVLVKGSSRCLYIWDSRSSREFYPCTPPANWRAIRDNSAAIVQSFFAAIGISLSWWLAQAFAILVFPLLIS